MNFAPSKYLRVAMDKLKNSMTNTFVLFTKYYKSMKMVIASRGDLKKFKEISMVYNTLNLYIQHHPDRNDMGTMLAKKIENILTIMQTPEVQKAFKMALRSPNARLAEMYYANIVTACITATTYLVARGYSFDDAGLTPLGRSSITAKDIAAIAPLAAVNQLGSISTPKEFGELITAATKPESLNESIVAGVAVGTAVVISTVYIAKVLTYCFYHLRIEVADQLFFLSEFLDNSSHGAGVTDETREAQLRWSKRFSDLAVKIDVQVAEASDKAKRDVDAETSEIESTDDDGGLL
jgi:hypothetical protein